VAPCSHTWHYKCIRSLLQGPSFPIFICPNCRATADLEAEVDDPSEEWQHLDSEDEPDEMEVENQTEPNNIIPEGLPRIAEPRQSSERRSTDRRSNGRRSTDRRSTDRRESDTVDTTTRLDTSYAETSRRPSAVHQVSDPIPIGNPSTGRNTRTPSPAGNPSSGNEGPITPRNDAGPWVFDGSAGRRVDDGGLHLGTMSLNAAAEMGVDS
jgi:E3 ubiquitin-protein ligase DMA1/2